MVKDLLGDGEDEGVHGISWLKVGEEYVPSDKMAELMLRGLDPATFGRVNEQGSGVGPKVIINVSI